MKFSELEVGDKVAREMEGFPGENNGTWENDGHVTNITEETIICDIYVGCSRRMVFDIETGVNVLGRDYGWLKTEPSQM